MKKTLIIAALLIAVAVPASALTTLDFEGVPQTYWYWGGRQNLGNYYAGATFGPTATILEKTVYGYQDNIAPPHSGDSVFWISPSAYVDIVFANPASYVEGWFTFAYSNGYMEAYDAADVLLDSDSMTANYGSNAKMSVSAAGIKRVRIHDDQSWWVGDDIAFEAGEQVIPEPTSLILGALGLSSLAGIRRFRRI